MGCLFTEMTRRTTMVSMARNKIGRLLMLCLVLASVDVASPFCPLRR